MGKESQKMFDSQRYRLKLYQSNNEKDIIVFIL